MGKIIVNGDEYSGACDTAVSVNYNNSLSGLKAKTVQEGIDELSESLGGVSQFIVDETTGKITGYKTSVGGADTVFPFKKITPTTLDKKTTYAKSFSFDVESGKTYILVFMSRSDIDSTGFDVTGGRVIFYDLSNSGGQLNNVISRICIVESTETTMTFNATSFANIFYPILICLD